MSPNNSLQEYIPELEAVVAAMTRFGSLEERRAVFHQEVHRAFDTEFFPSLLLLLSVMADVDETGPAMVSNVWEAIIFEIGDMFLGEDLISLSSVAACVDLRVVAEIAELDPTGEEDSGLAFVRRGVAYARTYNDQATWQAFIDDVRVEAERLAIATEAQILGGEEVIQLCKRWATAWRTLPDWLELIRWILSAIRCYDATELGRLVQEELEKLEEPRDAISCADWVSKTLRESGSEREADKAEELRLLLFRGGAGKDIHSILETLSASGPAGAEGSAGLDMSTLTETLEKAILGVPTGAGGPDMTTLLAPLQDLLRATETPSTRKFETAEVLSRLQEGDRSERRRVIQTVGRLYAASPEITEALTVLVGTLYPQNASDSLRSTREAFTRVVDVTLDEPAPICRGVALILNTLGAEHAAVSALLDEYTLHAGESPLLDAVRAAVDSLDS